MVNIKIQSYTVGLNWGGGICHKAGAAGEARSRKFDLFNPHGAGLWVATGHCPKSGEEQSEHGTQLELARGP